MELQQEKDEVRAAAGECWRSVGIQLVVVKGTHVKAPALCRWACVRQSQTKNLVKSTTAEANPVFAQGHGGWTSGAHVIHCAPRQELHRPTGVLLVMSCVGNARKEYASPLTATDFGLSLVLLSCVLLLLLLTFFTTPPHPPASQRSTVCSRISLPSLHWVTSACTSTPQGSPKCSNVKFMTWHDSPSAIGRTSRGTPGNCNLFFPLCNKIKSLCNLLRSAGHLFTSERRPLNEMETARFTLSIINQCGSGFTDTWSERDNLWRVYEGSKLKEKAHTETQAHAIVLTELRPLLVSNRNRIFTAVDTLFFVCFFLCGCCFYNKWFCVCFVTLKRFLPRKVLKGECENCVGFYIFIDFPLWLPLILYTHTYGHKLNWLLWLAAIA